jgi:hypothetical protein
MFGERAAPISMLKVTRLAKQSDRGNGDEKRDKASSLLMGGVAVRQIQ